MNTLISSKTERLAQAVADRQAQIVQLRRRHADVQLQVIDAPTDRAIGELLDVETRLAALAAGTNALQDALETAQAQEAAASQEAAKAAGTARLANLHARIAKRAPHFARVQAAADKLVTELRALVDEGEPLGRDAASIAQQLKGGRPHDTLGTVHDMAAGVSNSTAAALGAVVRDIVTAFGPARLHPFLEINYGRREVVTFAEAAQADAALLRTRLAP